MASGRYRGGAGERVLEGRHVIGLFVLMLLFSGVFFTLGYVMGRNQYDGQVRAAPNPSLSSGAARGYGVDLKTDSNSRRNAKTGVAAAPSETAAPPASDWEFYHAGEANKANERLKSAASAPKAVSVAGGSAPPKPAPAVEKTKSSLNAPLIPGGAYTLQVAALSKESDALALAENLQKKKFPAFVLTPGADKYYRVQVGPYADPQSAAIARKGLENAGFKAIVKH
jgi:cell division septation protein DedD